MELPQRVWHTCNVAVCQCVAARPTAARSASQRLTAADPCPWASSRTKRRVGNGMPLVTTRLCASSDVARRIINKIQVSFHEKTQTHTACCGVHTAAMQRTCVRAHDAHCDGKDGAAPAASVAMVRVRRVGTAGTASAHACHDMTVSYWMLRRAESSGVGAAAIVSVVRVAPKRRLAALGRLGGAQYPFG